MTFDDHDDDDHEHCVTCVVPTIHDLLGSTLYLLLATCCCLGSHSSNRSSGSNSSGSNGAFGRRGKVGREQNHE